MQQKAFLFFAILAFSCNPGKNLNQQAHQRDAGRDLNIKYPQQQVATPDQVNMSYDFERLFTPEQNKKIDSLVRLFEKSNLIAIKLVTIPYGKVTAVGFEDNNRALLKEWAGVHGNTDKAMVLSLSRDLNRVAIDYGSFIARFLSREEARQIINADIKPGLTGGAVFDATWKGLNNIMDAIRRNIKF